MVDGMMVAGLAIGSNCHSGGKAPVLWSSVLLSGPFLLGSSGWPSQLGPIFLEAIRCSKTGSMPPGFVHTANYPFVAP